MKEKKCWAGVVYSFTNLVDGKMYVGKTQNDPEQRKLAHFKAGRGKSKNYIHCAIRKHGAENFCFELLQRCHTAESLNKAEIRWIAKLGTLAPHGYNMTIGGEGVVGNKVTKAARKRISKACKAWYAVPENFAAHLAVRQSKEFIANTTAAQRTYWAAATPEIHRKRSRAAKKWRADPEKLKRQIAASHSEAARKKRVNSTLAWYADPSNRDAHCAALRTPRCRAKNSAARKAWWARRTETERAELSAKLSAAQRRRYSAMTPAESSTYWHKIHSK